MALNGRSLVLKGEIDCVDDVTVEGRVDGAIWCEAGAVTIAAGAEVTGHVIARDITVFGRASGQLIATEVVDLRPESSVDGTIMTVRLILNEGASFTGRAEPQHLEAALRVARYQRQQRDGSAPSTPPGPPSARQPDPAKPVIVRRDASRR